MMYWDVFIILFRHVPSDAFVTNVTVNFSCYFKNILKGDTLFIRISFVPFVFISFQHLIIFASNIVKENEIMSSWNFELEFFSPATGIFRIDSYS